jgi:hypothetical protein
VGEWYFDVVSEEAALDVVVEERSEAVRHLGSGGSELRLILLRA